MALRFRCLLVSVLSLACVATPAGAESGHSSPVGQWKTVDDNTGMARSVVLIREQNGKLFGSIQKLVDPDPHNPDPLCRECSGDQKGKPIVGLEILQNLHKDGDGWSGGTILDPDTGKVYKCLVSVLDGGTRLKVRGFLGFSLLGRTQYWLRQ